MTDPQGTQGRAKLHVALQDGFRGDAVRIEVADREVYRKDAVKTRLQISLADTFEVELPRGPATVLVTVASRGTSGSLPVDLDGDVYLGISLARDGSVTHRISDRPFGYV